ncbi:hypothetical protein MATR_04300 [Marivirga tractuosa]|uniref:Epidermal growth-factor receptor (EGFR) L domain n=1 Tax=Marivirga tractuosa (strain ATCC 23168 / DSM 4126 / NBRC 15989 / NCIMB 1408 / VKM B-1430 / H-43) TaxID=643867 RepID=E4TTA6_MARTH|nr:epidermal growth-factor receptor (egfr) l domain [Marivirga tractuosa]ADR21936.1 epidermal growth-factor receptor (EGFR) L domain [Marivirga tractuosa DSM 4126]BDD13605.1 hypothetical protein MATR_04300 [Marivirga tractuosa]
MKKFTLILLTLITLSCSDDATNIEPSTIYEGNYEIRSETDLISFSESGYTEINGNLVINYTEDIEDLKGLETLKKVNGILIRYNDELKSLEGLEGLSQIEFFTLSYNLNLNSLKGLDNLTKITSSIIIEQNADLKNLNGLDQLTEVGGDFFISHNDRLENFNGIESLQNVSRFLVLNNINLIDLTGLRNIVSTNRLQFDSNDLLNDFCILSNFLEQNPDPELFGARQNDYNPTVEDILNGNCTE